MKHTIIEKAALKAKSEETGIPFSNLLAGYVLAVSYTHLNEEVAAAANGTARIYCNKNFQRGGEKAGAAAVESISENIYSRKAKRRESL